MKLAGKLTAILLSVLMVTQTATVAAAETGEPDLAPPPNSVMPEFEEESEPAYILLEDNEQREENSKVFLMSDGTYMAAVYDAPIHVKGEDGSWEDIDNSLQESNAQAAEEEQEFETKNALKKIKLSKKCKEGKTVTLKWDGGEDIRWGLQGAAKVRGQIVESQEELEGDDRFLLLQNAVSKTLYPDVFPNVDVEYYISTKDVKENIILKTKDAQREFTAVYQIGKLLARQVDERTIELYAEEDPNTAVYTISAPEMIDNAGVQSSGIHITLEQQKKKEITVKITADPQWLEDPERVYPVVLDPVVQTYQNTSIIKDTFVASATPDANYGGYGSMYVGRESVTYGICRILTDFTLPELSKGDMVVKANLNMVQGIGGMSPESASIQVNAYEITRPWKEESATWNNMADAKKTEVLDYANTTNATTRRYQSWTITNQVKSWYNGAPKYGIMLVSSDESTFKRDKYYASGDPYLQGYYPGLSIFFVNNAGLESYWDYHSHSAGRAGTGYVNDYTGNLVFIAPVTASTGARAPLSISLCYNGYQAGMHFKNWKKGIILGWGWQSNLTQRIDVVAEANGTTDAEKAKFKNLALNGYKYVTLDDDGTEHYFKAKAGSTTQFVDEEGIGMTLTVNGSGDEYYKLEYKDGSKKTFTGTGYLLRVYDVNKNYYQLSYSGAYLHTITDGAGRATTLTRADTGAITAITEPDGRKTQLAYTGGNLTKITYPDGKVTNFSYDSANRLTQVKNNDNSRINYGYFTQGYDISKNRVASVTEYSTGGTQGNRVQFAYNPDNTTTFTYTANGNTVKEVSNFDMWGRTTSVINQSDYSATSYRYTAGSSLTGNANKLSAVAQTSATVHNILEDTSIENGGAAWSKGTKVTVDTGTAMLGNKSFKATQSVTTPVEQCFENSITSLAAGEYTFSAYVKTENVSGGQGAAIGATITNGSQQNKVYSETLNGTNGWTRIKLSFTVASGTTSVRLFGGLISANGTAWFDCLQLEKGSVMNPYNMLENTEFSKVKTGTYLPLGWETTNFASGDGRTSGRIEIKGSSTVNKNLYQTVRINKPASSIAFVASGKAEADSVPTDKGGERYFAIDVGIVYTDGSKQWEVIPFNYSTTANQYVSGPVMASEANKNKTISYINFYFIYYLNQNTVFIDDMQLMMDETGSTYTYDSKGNLISSKDNAKNNETYTFTNANELAKATERNNESYTYTYASGNAHQLTSARSSQTGIGMVYGYNGNGLVTKTQMGTVSTAGALDTTKPYLQASSTYNSSNNYVATQTDQRGKVTSYNINATTGLTNSITDPKGNATSYTYNSLDYQLKKISGSGSAGPVSVQYAYDASNRLSTVTHNGFNYGFTYDGFGNTTQVKAGNRTLVTNTYLANNGSLKKVAYGNGYQIQYTYDIFGRVTQETRGNTAYQYVYDARGNLAKVLSGGNVLEQYTYDIGDRLVSKTVPGGSIAYAYDNMDRGSKTTYGFSGQTKTNTYTYGSDNRLGDTTLMTGQKVTHTYDTLNRMTLRAAGLSGNTTMRAETSFLNVSGNRTTTLVSQYNNKKRVGSTDTLVSGYSYQYDANGNISKVTDHNGNYQNYYYDGLNQLIKVEDSRTGGSGTVGQSTIEYTYDAGGNITQEKVYNGIGETITGVLDTVSYTYGDTGWKDLLTNYNGDTITYDAIGNPLQYRDGMQFTWNGRQLASVAKDGKTNTYTYDQNGVRTAKTADGVTTQYFRDGSTILAEKTGNNLTWYTYDADGTRVGMVYNNAAYYYQYNMQGDVTQLVDATGNVVVEYTYSPWGAVTVSGTMKDTVGAANPFRYRGYYYDAETGLYYLNSRYYDPQTHRFINQDVFVSTGQGILGNNMFLYCLNNPINFSDSLGNIALIDDAIYLAMAAITAVFAIGIVAIVYVATTPEAQRGWSGFAQTVNDVFSNVGNSIASLWNGIAESTSSSISSSAATNSNSSIASISNSISNTDAKTRKKIQNESQRFNYWIAKYVDFGSNKGTFVPTAPISFSLAVNYVRSGGSVFAKSRSYARRLAITVGYGRDPVRDPRHREEVGYYPHYHDGLRKGGHIFYLG